MFRTGYPGEFCSIDPFLASKRRLRFCNGFPFAFNFVIIRRLRFLSALGFSFADCGFKVFDYGTSVSSSDPTACKSPCTDDSSESVSCAETTIGTPCDGDNSTLVLPLDKIGFHQCSMNNYILHLCIKLRETEREGNFAWLVPIPVVLKIQHRLVPPY